MKFGEIEEDGTCTVAIETTGDALMVIEQIKRQIKTLEVSKSN